jgi:DNA-binding MarR family transcriptional regulator
MNLTNASSYITKYALVVIVLLLVFETANPVYGVNHHYEQDFSDGLPTNVILKSYDFLPSTPQPQTHTFVVNSDGRLLSNGTRDPFITNTIAMEDHTAFGGWSFDAYIPSTAQHDDWFDRYFAVLWSELIMGPVSEPNSTNLASFTFFVENGNLDYRARNMTTIGLMMDKPFPMQKFDQSQHYDVVRTLDRFYLFVDGEIALNITLSANIGPVINYFTINTGRGNQIWFDNIKITRDYSGLLNGLLGIEETTSIASQETSVTNKNTSDSNNGLLLFGIGGSTIALASVISFWHISQKKRIAKLVKLSSNGRYPNVSNIISNVFDYKKSLYFLLLGHRTHHINALDENFEAELTSKMQRYKHFLHPFRLSIMQILYTNPKIASIEIRDKLNLSWSDYYNAIRHLEKRNLIRVFDDFDSDGSTRQFVVMEEEGAKEYEAFVEVIGTFVNIAQDYIPDYDGTDLYP